MPYPFLRPGERGRTPPDREAGGIGVRIVYGNGVVHFIPGSSPAAALVLVQAAIPPDLLADPATGIEFGEKVGVRGWVTQRVLKEAKKPRVGGA